MESPDAGQPQTVRVLTIGNSFANDACRHLRQIADSVGAAKIIIGSANIGGCTLEKHANLAADSAADSRVRPYRGSDGQAWSLQDYLKSANWDFVTVQQMSALSYKPETYRPHLGRLVSVIRQHAPQAQILVHETWAYRPDSPLLESDNLTQEQMYERLRDAYENVAKRFNARIIPVGTAFQLARRSPGRAVVVPPTNFDYRGLVYPELPQQTNSLVKGWHWRKQGDAQQLRFDYKHGNTKGSYLAGLVWYEVLSNHEATDTSYVPDGLSPEDASFLRKIAHQAVSTRRPAAVGR